jgi:hypothetical protein
MMDNNKLLAHIAREIDKLRGDQASFLSTGRAGDYPEYRHICGIIRGLSHAESIVNDLVQRMEKFEDE